MITQDDNIVEGTPSHATFFVKFLTLLTLFILGSIIERLRLVRSKSPYATCPQPPMTSEATPPTEATTSRPNSLHQQYFVFNPRYIQEISKMKTPQDHQKLCK
jgi:hypothetical protein